MVLKCAAHLLKIALQIQKSLDIWKNFKTCCLWPVLAKWVTMSTFSKMSYCYLLLFLSKKLSCMMMYDDVWFVGIRQKKTALHLFEVNRVSKVYFEKNLVKVFWRIQNKITQQPYLKIHGNTTKFGTHQIKTKYL